MGLQKNVLETLFSTPARWINFTFANRAVSVGGYYMIGFKVAAESIKCSINPDLTDQAMYDATNNKIIAKDHSYGETYLDEKALLIHECTHAMLDCFYHTTDMNGNKAGAVSVLVDETIAYIAQAMYLIASKAAQPSNKIKPDYKAVEVVRPKLEALMTKQWSGSDVIHFTTADVAVLQTAIKQDPLYSDWASTAVHNG